MFGFHPRDIPRLTVGELLRYIKAAKDRLEGGTR